MKLTSVIFLIISVILLFTGVFLCNYAREMAPNEAAIDGYIVNENGDTVVEYYFEEDGISTVNVDLADCDVQIVKGGKTSYVVMKNFLTTQYICSVSGKILNVSNNISLSDYINFDGTGVKFGGVWQTLRAKFVDKGNTDRLVYVYIGEDETIKQINVTSNGGVVRLVGFNDGQNVSLTLNNSTVELDSVTAESIKMESVKSDVTLSNINSESFEGNIEKGSFNVVSAVIDEMEVESTAADITLLNLATVSLDIESEDGNVSLTTPYVVTDYIIRVTAPDGKVLLDDVDMGTDVNTADGNEHPGNIKITCKEGSLKLSFGDVSIPVEDNTTGDQNQSGNGTDNSGGGGTDNGTDSSDTTTP